MDCNISTLGRANFVCLLSLVGPKYELNGLICHKTGESKRKSLAIAKLPTVGQTNLLLHGQRKLQSLTVHVNSSRQPEHTVVTQQMQPPLYYYCSPFPQGTYLIRSGQFLWPFENWTKQELQPPSTFVLLYLPTWSTAL